MEIEKWEYQLRILYADITHQGVTEYLKKQYPDWKPSRYSPEALEKYMDEQGERGWELVHMEPIYGSGNNADIYWQGGAVPGYSHAYFCVFKRRKRT